jgi:hypothetical protein
MDRLDALRLYVEVAEEGSFSGVASQRTIATSTVALAVTQLEQEFSAPNRSSPFMSLRAVPSACALSSRALVKCTAAHEV